VARSSIARALHLSLPTVMRIVDDLTDQGWVRPIDSPDRIREKSRSPIEYHKEGHAVIGIDLGGTKMFGALANIGGEIIHETTVNAHGSSGEDSYAKLLDVIQELFDIPRKRGQKIRGLAIGAPGVTHTREGIVEWAPSLNWRDYPLKRKLEKQFRVPVVVENDVNLAVLGEQWFGAGHGAHNMVLITLGTGVGAGLIIDGLLYRGHCEAAGEVGYFLSSRSELNRPYDQFGALESLVSGTGIAQRARAALEGRISPEQLAQLTSLDVFEAYRRREEWSYEVVNDTVDYLSVAIINVSTLLDPEVIILGGGVSESADVLLPGVEQRVRNVLPHAPTIRASTLGRRAAVMGAIAQVVHATSDYMVARRMV
jgi:glucokinase